MKYRTLAGRWKNVDIQKYRIDWGDDSLSKFQFRVKQFLMHYWKNQVVCEEFPVAGTRMRFDFFNVTKKIAVECDGEQHNQYSKHFHKSSYSLFQKQIERDDDKRDWCELNGVILVRIYQDDVPNLSVSLFRELGVNLQRASILYDDAISGDKRRQIRCNQNNPDDQFMAKQRPTYNPLAIEQMRKWTAQCETWPEARRLLAEKLQIDPDNVTKMNRKYGLWRSTHEAAEKFSQAGLSVVETLKNTGDALKLNGRPIRRLFWDIETSPNVVLSWRIGYKINLDHGNLLKERAIICIGYKWEGESQVHVLHWDENQCDKKMLEEFLEVANSADELVAHNGDKFDMPWFKTRCLFHGLPTTPDYKTVDTLQWARRKFYFNSNRMDYIAKFLGLGGKIKTEFGLWKDIVLNKCPKAMKLMTDYCKKDVTLLEQVWLRLSRMVRVKTHAGVLAGRDKWSCPHDSSTHVEMRKFRVTAGGTKQYQFQCMDCGSYYTVSEKAYKDFQENKNAHLSTKA